MSYFNEKIRSFSNDYGHLTGTLVSLVDNKIREGNVFEALGNALRIKTSIEGMLAAIESVKKHCEIIDDALGSDYYQRVDSLRNILRNKALSTVDLLIKNIPRKSFDVCSTLIKELAQDLATCAEDTIELVDLKEKLDRQKLPIEYLEFFEKGEMRFVGRILSYCMREENEKLISTLVSPFLEDLGFQPIYAGKDFPPNRPPGQNVEEFIRKCGTLIAYLTKDQDIYPSPNVIHEIGVASDKALIIFAEKGTNVPSNLTTLGTYYSFERQNSGDMLLKLLHGLRLLKIYDGPKNVF